MSTIFRKHVVPNFSMKTLICFGIFEVFYPQIIDKNCQICVSRSILICLFRFCIEDSPHSFCHLKRWNQASSGEKIISWIIPKDIFSFSLFSLCFCTKTSRQFSDTLNAKRSRKSEKEKVAIFLWSLYKRFQWDDSFPKMLVSRPNILLNQIRVKVLI